VRVIAGSARGRLLKVPKGMFVRPTADRVKESVFAILSPLLGQAAVLDLYAGSGALGIEALSRGAERAVFVEKNAAAAACIKANLEIAGVKSLATVMTMPVARALHLLSKHKETFDLVFMDPPYERSLVIKTLHDLQKAEVVKPGSICVIEHSSREEIPPKVEKFTIYRQVCFGDTSVSFLKLTWLGSNGL
jgi:16S rRNA (guanine966-N2)-methyltransferase